METVMYEGDIMFDGIAKGLESLKKAKSGRTHINIILTMNDINRIKQYLNKGTGDIDDILIEITTQA